MKKMKQYTIFAFVVLVVFTSALSGCSKSTTSKRSQGPAIRVGVSVVSSEAMPAEEVANKAIITPDAEFSASIAGWEAVDGQLPDYNVPCIWNASFDAQAGSLQPVELIPQPYYNADVGKKIITYMKAWYPAAVPAADGTVTFMSELSDFKGDGTDDVMLTDVVSGSRDDVQQKNMEFRHLLSQLRFKIKSNVDLAAKPKLISIVIHGVQLPQGLNLATDAVIYTAEADYTIMGIEPNTFTFTTTEQSVGTPLLLRPFEGNTLTADIVTSFENHENVMVTIDTDQKFIPGKAYTITLNYTGDDSRPLNVTVSVSPWQDIEGGDIDT